MNIEYRHQTGFNTFLSTVKGKKVAVLYDVNTKPFADDIIKMLKNNSSDVLDAYYSDEELIPSEDKCEYALEVSKKADYVLAVGSGTLNDMAKSVATKLGIPSGVLATAPSMDGYCSAGSALMRNGVKVTDTVNPPSDVLIDLNIVCNAPKIMTAAGFGDIVGKYTCLTDWKMANAVLGEEINQKAFSMMEDALNSCVGAYDELTKYTGDAVAKLMNALVVAGLSMAECGNSRPASGSEHHMSHFLEMDFVKRGEKIPMHGIKVAIGCLISIEIYNYILNNKIKFNGCEKVYEYVKELPSVESVKSMLEGMGCPTKFSEIGVRKETMEEMLEKAYTVRDRFTVLTLANKLNLTEDIKPFIMAKYY